MRSAVISPSRCSCGFSGEVLYHVENNFVSKCPGCQANLSYGQCAEKPQRFYGNTRFYGRDATSLEWSFHPNEIAKLKKLGVDAEFHDNGRVSFADSAQKKRFNEQMKKLENHQPQNA